ncbi:MAG: 4-hydroxybutyryl-CoA dehydratase, partial [Desulfobacterales bacterium]|nr:4-hydroxybutyryl-CoA dehydratase [Desulfobacterales bacterium]
MALKTGKEYLESVDSLELEAHVLGKKTDELGDHGLISPSREALAFTYDAAHDKDKRDMFVVEESLCGDPVNRFTHLHRSAEDLVNKVKMQRHCGVSTACCFQRCVGMDAANAIYSTTHECDQKHGTDYHQRFKDYWTWIQKNDLVVDGAMTDPKGDR